MHLTRDQTERLRNFWYVVSEIQNSDLASPKDIEGGESITMKLVLESVGEVFEAIDRQLISISEGATELRQERSEAEAPQYTCGLTESQLRILSNIRDAVDGLGAAMNYEEPGGRDTNPGRQVFAGMAQGIWGAVARLSSDIERQKLGGAQ